MNCKEGDKAVIIKSQAGNEGKIVLVHKLLGISPVPFNDMWYCPPNEGYCWEVESLGSPIKYTGGQNLQVGPINDLWLRPLDQDFELESIEEEKELEKHD